MRLTKTAEEALQHFDRLRGGSIEPLGHGLINDTFRVTMPANTFVLQRVNSIFDPAIHYNIAAVTERLADAGLCTPRLEPSRDARWWIDLGERGVWRAMTFVDGASFEKVQSIEQARSAASLIARFHAALAELDHAFVGTRSGVHDTAKHLAVLRQALQEHRAHRLYEPLAELGPAILAAAERLPPLPELPNLIGHGDLKLNNVRFTGRLGPDAEQALCLIDLDTVGPVALAHELGDAWRSWCNPAGEDATEVQFDMKLFEASWEGYRDGIGRGLSGLERRALRDAPAWLSLELAARFAADALRECYFGFDATRFSAAGEHNLVRARGQWALHAAILATRDERAAILEVPAD